MEVLRGIAASPGVAIGTVFILGREEIVVDERFIGQSEIAKEIKRLHEALDSTCEELEAIQKATIDKQLSEYAVIFDAHLAIIKDPVFINKVEEFITDRKVVAEHAVSRVFRSYIARLEQIDEEYLSQRADDLRDLEKRCINNLSGLTSLRLEEIKTDVILISRVLTPSETATLPKDKVLGIATDFGGLTSHASLIASAMEIPAVVGLKNVSLHVSSGDVVIVDGSGGEVIISPDEKQLEKYRLLQRDFGYMKHLALFYRNKPCLPLDIKSGHEVKVMANVDNVEDVKRAKEKGAFGVGLFRTEYLLFNRAGWPSEEDQFKVYLKALEYADGMHITFRTFDVDSDKVPEKQHLYSEQNPSLGMRGIRLSRARPDVFRTQIRALLKAAAYWSSSKGLTGCSNMGIMFPMVTVPHEYTWAKVQVKSITEGLEREGFHLSIPRDIRTGAMIEVPSILYSIEYLKPRVDFLSVGTNDLIQYLFAADRTNERMSDLYTPANKALLTILRDLRLQIPLDDAKKTPDLSICGEMASDHVSVLMLLGLGYRHFSVSVPMVPVIKYVLRKVSIHRCKSLVRELLEKAIMGLDVTEVRKYLENQLVSLSDINIKFS